MAAASLKVHICIVANAVGSVNEKNVRSRRLYINIRKVLTGREVLLNIFRLIGTVNRENNRLDKYPLGVYNRNTHKGYTEKGERRRG